MDKVKLKSVDFLKKSAETSQLALFSLSDFNKKKVEICFDAEQTSSDGGLLLLNEVNNRIGLIDRLTNCLQDTRHQSYVAHGFKELITQRVMQIAAGYEDANDCDTLRDDNILKICCNKENRLSSQPTMSRFENQISNSELYQLGLALVDQFMTSYATQPDVIILDCDDTDAKVYGDQQLSLFNNYYGEKCFMPLHIYEGLSGKLIASILKPGRRSKGVDVFNILSRLINYLRKHWPDTLIILRGDSHFCSKEFMEWSQDQYRVGFVTGLTGNQILHKETESVVQTAQHQFKVFGKKIKRYHSFSYQAGSWQHAQRVVAKIEVTEKGTNIRYIVSSIDCIGAKQLYEKAYCARGAAELRIKDHKTYLKSDRMSCSSFKANQFRLFLHSAAYVLIHSLQKEMLIGTEFASSTMRTIQLKIIKVATKIKILKTKVKIAFPISFPSKPIFEKLLAMLAVIRINT